MIEAVHSTKTSVHSYLQVDEHPASIVYTMFFQALDHDSLECHDQLQVGG
jgi:hypothetical protein